MYCVYALKSKIANFYYKGFCQDLNKRLLQHNSGQTKSNKKYAPYEIVYTEEYIVIEDVLKREKYFKSAAGRRYLKNILTNK